MKYSKSSVLPALLRWLCFLEDKYFFIVDFQFLFEMQQVLDMNPDLSTQEIEISLHVGKCLQISLVG